MVLHTHTLGDDSLEADICIVGAGPAGIAIARALQGTRLDVLILESGGREADSATSALNDGSAPEPFAALRTSRHRGPGGSVHLWNTPVRGVAGAKYAPLDPCDFEPRPDDPGWPFDRTHLEPFYRRAQAICGLGPFAYEASDWTDARGSGLPLPQGVLQTCVYQLGRAADLTRPNLDAIRSADNVRLLCNATVCTLETDSQGRRVTCARAADRHGRSFTVRAPAFVLAGGTIENTRLLLSSAANSPAPTWSGNPWLGRGFMEHPRDQALTWVPSTPELFHTATFYDAHRARDGTIIGGRLTLTDDAVRTRDVLNASATLFPTLARPAAASRLRSALRRFGWRGPAEGYGWSRTRVPEHVYSGFRLLLNLEQRPHPENRITLDATRDALGVPRVVLHWQWRDEEQSALDRLHRIFVEGFHDAGIGRIEVRPRLRPDPNAHHHAGTTRMSANARNGVVDPDARVHGTDNLFIAGAAVFPTAGFVNPTLTIVAMALRLADHLAQRA